MGGGAQFQIMIQAWKDRFWAHAKLKKEREREERKKERILLSTRICWFMASSSNILPLQVAPHFHQTRRESTWNNTSGTEKKREPLGWEPLLFFFFFFLSCLSSWKDLLWWGRPPPPPPPSLETVSPGLHHQQPEIKEGKNFFVWFKT